MLFLFNFYILLNCTKESRLSDYVNPIIIDSKWIPVHTKRFVLHNIFSLLIFIYPSLCKPTHIAWMRHVHVNIDGDEYWYCRYNELPLTFLENLPHECVTNTSKRTYDSRISYGKLSDVYNFECLLLGIAVIILGGHR